MNYIEYEIYRIKYLDSQQAYDDILTEKEELFAKTQPKSVKFDQERVGGGIPESTFDSYLIEKERKKIDLRLAEAKTIMEEREELLQVKEQELRNSNEVIDKLYCLKVLDRLKMARIARIINYSESHIYRLMGEIYRNIKKMRENENYHMLH